MRPATDVALGGRYRLISRIAVGGMGEVWTAHDESLARRVAVKVLREEFAGDEGFLERFRTEARNSAHLSHPNIAQLYDYGEQDGSGFLVMELVLGEPMSELLDRQPVLPTLRLLPILAQTARALHAAHAGGVVHRDVKPGNILLARSGRVKITDFGISTATNQVPMTASGMVMGTAQYLSPEQAMGRAATPASDVYSLGIVAYEALVGNRPFTGPTAVDIAIAHVKTAVPPMPTDIDPDLSALVMRMLAKDPDLRPRSAASLARALDDLLERTPPGGTPALTGRHARAVDVAHAAEQEAAGARRTASHPVVTGASTGGPSHDGSSDPGSPVAGPSVGVPGPSTGGVPVGRAEAALPGTHTAPEPGPPVLADPVVPAPPVIAPGTPAPGGTRDHGATRGGSGPTRPPRRTSTTTGLRWGQVSRPLLALVLMVVFALLGAAFADRLWGPSRAGADPAPQQDRTALAVVTSTGRAPEGGTIDPDLDRSGSSAAARTTTAKDE